MFDSDGAKVYASSDQETIVFLTEDTSTGAYYVDYYSYDYCMGTLETPTAIETKEDLKDYLR